MAREGARVGAVSAGDHLQTGYQLWLVGHQLEHARAPWRDPYSFQPVVEPRPNFAGWPFGLPFWPLHRALGAVAAWNVFLLLGFVLSGACAALWLRSLRLRRGAAIAGGLAFCLAPYVVAQASLGHLLAWVAALLPLSLYAWERGLRGSSSWLALSAAALVSIPLSGQVHLALAAVPFFLLYTLLRRRAIAVALGSTLLAMLAGGLVYAAALRDTVGTGGRTFAQVERYSADASGFLSRTVPDEPERFVFLGWLTPALAVAGLVVLILERRRDLAAALGLGALVPILLALGANLPGYEALWRHLPGLKHTRVPERLLPVACLALAALAAFAVNRVRWPGTAAIVAALLLLDLHVGGLFERARADEGNAAYAVLRDEPPGRLLDLPVYLPDRQEAGVYLYYSQQAPRERVDGYSTTAPVEADRQLRALRRNPCSDLDALGVRYLVLHAPGPTCGAQLIGRDGDVSVYRR